jgi:hypothetical protein
MPPRPSTVDWLLATGYWLLQTPAGQRIGDRIYARKDTLHTVHLLDVEVAQVLRRLADTFDVAGSQEC